MLLHLYDSLAEAMALAPAALSAREADDVLDASRRSIYRIVHAFRKHALRLPPTPSDATWGAERRDTLLAAFAACQV